MTTQKGIPNQWISLVTAILIAFLFSRCEDTFFEKPETRDFLIPRGDHYATPRLYETFTGSTLAFRATFDESARYQLSDPSLQASKNKLMGFSDCHSLHHENSARFAWQWYNDRLEIFAYCYTDSVRVEEFVAAVNIGEENLYEISIADDNYVFRLNGEKKAEIARNSDCEDGTNYMLYPYFGGQLPAPHDVRVKIEMVK